MFILHRPTDLSDSSVISCRGVCFSKNHSAPLDNLYFPRSYVCVYKSSLNYLKLINFLMKIYDFLLLSMKNNEKNILLMFKFLFFLQNHQNYSPPGPRVGVILKNIHPWFPVVFILCRDNFDFHLPIRT